MRRETAFALIPVITLGLTLATTRRRTADVLRLTREDGETDIVRTSQVLLVKPSGLAVVEANGYHRPLTSVWVTADPRPLEVMQSIDQFWPELQGFVELSVDDGAVFVNPEHVLRVRSSGMLSGRSVTDMRPTTEILFEGQRRIVVQQDPDYVARALGRSR